MPHLVMLYSANLDRHADIDALCRQLADKMIEQRDDAGQAVFPPGGTRVLAYPAPHYAIADGGAAGRAAGGDGDYAFAYLNLRVARGRSPAVQQRVGEAIKGVTEAFFKPLLAERHIGVTVQVDEGAEVYDAKISSLHPLFKR
jgi:5-carboxymethyl-2-hydroxymuconate isomerase